MSAEGASDDKCLELVTAEKGEILKNAILGSLSRAIAIRDKAIAEQNDQHESKKGKKEDGKRKKKEEKREEKKEKRRKSQKSEPSEPSTSALTDSDDSEHEIVKKKPKKIMLDDSDDDIYEVKDVRKEVKIKKEEVDSDEERRRVEKVEKEARKRAKQEIKEAENRAKEERRKVKEEKQKEKEREERIRKAENEASKRRKKEAEEAANERKRKRKEMIEDSDAEEGSSKKEEKIERKRFDSQASTSSSFDKSLLNPRDATGKNRKQLLTEFSCITTPHLELKEFNDFCDIREILKEYGLPQGHQEERNAFPLDQLQTCDGEECPFILTYQMPFSALYQEARKRWTPTINDAPSSSHLKAKCVNCDKPLSLVSVDTWRNYLGAHSHYCSVKCVSGIINKVMRNTPDAETVTVMNVQTGETVNSGVYTRELHSFFLLSPQWMPFSANPTSEPPKKKNPTAIITKDKEREAREREKLSKMAALAKPIPKKKPETTENSRQSNRTQMENAMTIRVEKMHMKGVDRKQLRDLAEHIEEKLFDKCDRNLSHPKYRVWKQQFIHNFEAESAREFVIGVVLKRISVDKLVSMDANSLRNPACWKTKPVGIPIQNKRKSNVVRNPLDSIIGDDTRDTTAEHMSHAFSKTCKVCQSKQLEEAQEKIKKQEEEKELKERREKTKELREIMLREEEARRRRVDEEKRRRSEQNEREERERRMQREMEEMVDNDDDYGGGGGGDTPEYNYEPMPRASDERRPSRKERNERRTPKKPLNEWEFSLRIFMADEPFDSNATPIFTQTDDNRPMFRLFARELADKTFTLHTPRRIQEFLIDSNLAMNNNRSCAFAVMKLSPKGSAKSYRKILDYNLEQDQVYQLSYPLGGEILSAFLFPHRGSEILHDTFAPVKYNIGTTDNCFMLIMVLHSNYGERFLYSVRLSDIEMKSQLMRMEREKMMQTSWRKEEERDREQQWRNRNRSRSRTRSPSPGSRRKSRESERSTTKTPQNGEGSSAVPTMTAEDLAGKKFKFILQIVENCDQIQDIVTSAQDFMVDPDVTEVHKNKIREIIERKIEEEKALKRAARQKLRMENQIREMEAAAAAAAATNGSLPPTTIVSEASNVAHIDFSVPPPMIVKKVSTPLVVPLVTLGGGPKIIATSEPCTSMPSHIVPIAPPVSMIPSFSALPPVPPPPVPQQFPETFSMSEQQIVNDAILRGTVAPIPQELLMAMGGPPAPVPAPVPVPLFTVKNTTLEEDMRMLMETEKRIQMEQRFMKDMDEMEERTRRRTQIQHNGEDHMASSSLAVNNNMHQFSFPPPANNQMPPIPPPDNHHAPPPIHPLPVPPPREPSPKKKYSRRSRVKQRRHTSESMDVETSSDSDNGSSSRSSSATPPPPPPPPPPPDMSVPPPPVIRGGGVPLPVPPPPPMFSPSMILPPPPPPLPSEEKRNSMEMGEIKEEEVMNPVSPRGMPMRGRGGPWRGPPPMIRGRGGPPQMRGGRGMQPPRGSPMMRGGPPMRGGPHMRGGPGPGGPPPMRGGPMFRGGMGGPPGMNGPPRGSPMRGGGPGFGGPPPLFFQDPTCGRGGPPPPRGNMNNSWRGGPPPPTFNGDWTSRY